MPELPEVQTTLTGLKPHLEDQSLTEVTIRTPKLRLPIPPETATLLTGRTLSNLRRRNKFILADTDDAYTLLIHLGMSGRLTVWPQDTTLPPPEKHDHILLTTPTAHIRFNDARRFGLFLRLPTATLENHPLLKNLGPEPFDETLTPARFHQKLTARKTALKPSLVDNTLLVGVGNIYASESLFRAHLNPTRRTDSLTRRETTHLLAAIRETLTEAIAAGGSSLRDFRQADGTLGYFQHTFRVYGRTGQPCTICGTPILSAPMAQRNTFWCPTCQPC